MTTAGGTPPSLEESFVQQAAQRALEAHNAHDADRFVALMTEDVIVDHSAAPTTMLGLAEVRSFYIDSWKAFQMHVSNWSMVPSCIQTHHGPACSGDGSAQTRARSIPQALRPQVNGSRSRSATSANTAMGSYVASESSSTWPT
jgi:hypothetical protein